MHKMVLSRDSTTTTTTTCQNNRVQRDDDSAQMPYKSPSLHCLNKGNPGYVDNFTLGRSHSHQCVNDTGLPDPKGNTDNSFCSTDSMLDISGGNYSSADNIYSSVDNFNIDKAISSAAEGYSIYGSTRTLACSNEKLLLSDDSQYWSSDNFAISTDNIASSSDNIASSSDNIAYYTDNITNSTDNIISPIDTAVSVSTDNLYISSRQNASKEAKQGKLNAEKRRHSCFSIRKEVTKRIKDNKEAESRTGEHADFYTRRPLLLASDEPLTYSSFADLQPPTDPTTITNQAAGHKDNLPKGAFLALLSGILFTANNFVLVHAKIAPLDAVLVRGLVHTFVLGLYYRSSIWCDKVYLVIIQGCCAAIGLICALYAVSLAPVPDALTIIFTSPVSTLILAAIFLGEGLSAMKCSSILLLMMGVLLVCKPSFIFNNEFTSLGEDEGSTVGLGLAVAAVSSLLAGVTNTISRHCKGVPHGALVFWIAIFAILISAGGERFLSESCILSEKILEITWLQWGCLLGMAVSGLVAYLSLAKSLQLMDPTFSSSIRSLEIILAFGVQSVIDKCLPDAFRIIGAALVSTGICVASFEGWISDRTRRRQGYEALD